MFSRMFRNVDWVLIISAVPILVAGLVTMSSFGADNTYFWKQLLWIAVAFFMCVIVSRIDARIFTKTNVLVGLYLFGCAVLVLVLVAGSTIKGATSWLDLGGFSLQPSDPMKIILILVLAKYLSRRHMEIAHPKHILITAAYLAVPFLLVFAQPDFGSAIIFGAIWFGMILVAGISRKHLLLIGGLLLAAFIGLWLFVFAPYQKARIMNFIHPLSDIQGTGYNAYQSVIAVGSGQVMGKGLGYGTQSRLSFLPEYRTDFIFAAYAEEWGLIGSILLLLFFGFLISRILSLSQRGSSNFEILFGVGVAIYFLSHSIINIGMNIGLMPVTGITLPLMSYGGSHLIAEFLALGILMSMRQSARVAHKDDTRLEFLGLE